MTSSTKWSNIRTRFWIREEKRNKRHDIIINDSIREALEEYLTAYPAVASDPNHFSVLQHQNERLQ